MECIQSLTTKKKMYQWVSETKAIEETAPRYNNQERADEGGQDKLWWRVKLQWWLEVRYLPKFPFRLWRNILGKPYANPGMTWYGKSVKWTPEPNLLEVCYLTRPGPRVSIHLSTSVQRALYLAKHNCTSATFHPQCRYVQCSSVQFSAGWS